MAILLLIYFIYPCSAEESTAIDNPFMESDLEIAQYGIIQTDWDYILSLDELREEGYNPDVMSCSLISLYSSVEFFVPYDVDGDGMVTVMDLVLVKNHLLGIRFLSADECLRVTGSEDLSSVNISYLLIIKDFILNAKEKSISLEQVTQLLDSLDRIDKVRNSIYVMLSFFVCVILPLCGLVWYLQSIFRPFFGYVF